MKLKNTVLIVNDLEQAKAFYRQILNLKVLLDFHGYATLTSGLVLESVEIWKENIHKTDEELLFAHHTCELSFETEDIDAFIHVLSENHVTLLHPLKEEAWGQRVVRFYDPDGHIIAVSESLRKIIKRLISQGLSYEELAHKLRLPLDYIKRIADIER